MLFLLGLFGVFVAGAAVVAAFSLVVVVLRFVLKLVLIPLIAIAFVIKLVFLLAVGLALGIVMLPFVAVTLLFVGLVATPFVLAAQSRRTQTALTP